MPYISKTFNHVIANSSLNAWTYEKTTNEIITYQSSFKERKGYTDQFFIDLKEVLQQTNLTITFDDENNIFNIFDIDFMLKCLDSCCNYWTNTSYYTYSGIRPVIILPRISTADNSSNPQYSLENFGYGKMVEGGSSYLPYNNTNHWINCNTSPNDEVKRQVNYTIKIYYNTNYIICSYISFNGYEVPLFCFIQGEIVTTKEKAVYLSSCINNQDDNQYHKIAIPSQNTDKTKYYDYLPSISNTTKLGNNKLSNNKLSNNAIFDKTIYPSSSIIAKLSSDGTVNSDVFMNNVTAYGGMITFNNVFDVSRITTDNLPSQISTNALYTINGENYYCPGASIPGYNNDSNTYGRYIFKI